MKHSFSFILFLLAFAALAQAQTKAQPKLRITAKTFSVKYELGDKDVTEKDVRLHLEKTCPPAYYQWRKAESANTTSVIFSAVALGGALTGLFAKKTTTKAAGGVVGAAGVAVSLVCILSGSARRDKAADLYNKQYGY